MNAIDWFWAAFLCGLIACAVMVGACAGLRIGVSVFLSKPAPMVAQR